MSSGKLAVDAVVGGKIEMSAVETVEGVSLSPPTSKLISRLWETS